MRRQWVKRMTWSTKHLLCHVLRSCHLLRFTFYLCGFLLISTSAWTIDDEGDSLLPNYTQDAYLVRQITFEGNEHLDRKILSRLLGMQTGHPYRRKDAIAGLTRIIDEYRNLGYMLASITPEVVKLSRDQIYLHLCIKEGTLVHTGKILISGNHRFSTQHLLTELGLQKGTPFSKIALEHGIEKILTLYSENGHPKTEIEPSDFQLSTELGEINLHLKIHEKEQIHIGRVRVSGLKKTKPNVILRELPVQVGQIYDQRKIDQSLRHLQNLGYFYEINPSTLEETSTPDKVTFHAHVTEARTGRFTGVIGYAPPNSTFDAAPELTGVIEAHEHNLLGTARRARFFWKSGLVKTLLLGYEEPWTFGKPIDIGIEYAQVKQRNQFTNAKSEEQSGSLKITSRLRIDFDGILILSYKRIDVPPIDSSFLYPSDSDMFPNPDLSPSHLQSAGSVQGQVENGAKYSVTFGLIRDSRDYFLNPTRGRRDRIAFEISRGDFKLRKLWIELQQYFPTWRKQVIAIGLHGAATWGNYIPPTELFYLGGANSLRGYDEDWFSGPRSVHTNFEYRLIVGRTSQIFTFVDLGAVTELNRPSVFDSFRVGYGLGMRLESKGSLMRINYGLAEGNSVLQGKIHVNLGTSF